MCVDQATAGPAQVVGVDERKRLVIRGNLRNRQSSQERKDKIALSQIAESNFSDDERMGENTPLPERRRERLVARAQMIDPDRRVYQNHFGRRRGGAFAFGSLPPSNARRRALSRSIKARKASRTTADFSWMPVNS